MTLKEIAERAGVSRGTVDRVMKNRGGVNPETEKRVRRIVEESGYTPNRAAWRWCAANGPWAWV